MEIAKDEREKFRCLWLDESMLIENGPSANSFKIVWTEWGANTPIIGIQYILFFK